jgi:hypothetical protein
MTATVESVRKDKGGICSSAIGKVDVLEKVKGAIAKGFVVKLPPKLFRPIVLPAGIEQSVDIQGRAVNLGAHPTGVVVTAKRLWYGADLGADAKP